MSSETYRARAEKRLERSKHRKNIAAVKMERTWATALKSMSRVNDAKADLEAAAARERTEWHKRDAAMKTLDKEFGEIIVKYANLADSDVISNEAYEADINRYETKYQKVAKRYQRAEHSLHQAIDNLARTKKAYEKAMERYSNAHAAFLSANSTFKQQSDIVNRSG